MKRQRRWFSVVNFDKYQHYKDRAPKWIKLYLTLLDDNDFADLTDEQKWWLVGIWLLAARIGNRLPYDGTFIGSRIGSYAVDLDGLVRGGWLAVEADTVSSEPVATSVQLDTELTKPQDDAVQNRTLEGEGDNKETRDISKRDNKSRAHSLPEDWSLTDDLAKAATDARREHGLGPINLILAATRFKNYWLGIGTTARGRKSDWRRTWINWALTHKTSGADFDVMAAIEAAKDKPDESI